MIEVTHLSKSYGGYRAVDDVSFRVDKGEVVGFLGPNGAGKSTTLRILSGFLGPTRGKVRVGGHDIVDEPDEARALLGYMPETSPLYPELRVREYLSFRAELKRVPRKLRKDAIQRALESARVDDVATVMIGHLSKGYRQRVGLADALVGSPPLLILDEPTAGLDPNQIREVRALVKELAKEHTILLSTHILSEVQATCSRALVIHRGKLVAEGTIEELVAMQEGGLALRVRGAEDALVTLTARVAATSGVSNAALHREAGELGTIAIDLARGSDLGALTEELVRAAVEAGVGVRAVGPRVVSLEEVFGALTQSEVRGADR
jgi:ABC-2 type transport system ATP-binding protein